MAQGIIAPFTVEIGELVCAGLIECKPMKTIANELGVCSRTIWRWQRSNPIFAEAVRLARADAAHAMVDEAERVAREMDPKRARNVVQVLLFAAERRNRQAYGPSVDVAVTERVDLGGTLIEARKRTLLPGCDLAPSLALQTVDYTMIEHDVTTDNESAVSGQAVNPFD